MLYWFQSIERIPSESDKFIRQALMASIVVDCQNTAELSTEHCLSLFSVLVTTATTNSFVNISAYLTPTLYQSIYDSMVFYLRFERIGLE